MAIVEAGTDFWQYPVSLYTSSVADGLRLGKTTSVDMDRITKGGHTIDNDLWTTAENTVLHENLVWKTVAVEIGKGGNTVRLVLTITDRSTSSK